VIGNRLITRGLGTSRGASGRAGLVTQGFGGVPSVIIRTLETVPRRVVKGSSDYGRRQLDELNVVVLWAKLIEINSKPPSSIIQGSVRVKIDETSGVAVLVERFVSRISKTWSDIKITVKRLK
jgi:hypothetical protein